MGQQGEDRHLAEKRRPGQREGEGMLAQLFKTFGRMYDCVITWYAEGGEVTEASDGTKSVMSSVEAWAVLRAVFRGPGLANPTGLGPSHKKHLTTSALRRTRRDRGYW